MPVVFRGAPQPLYPGDILLSRATIRQVNPIQWGISAVLRSPFVHGTLVLQPTQLEWSIEWAGPHMRKTATDVECWAYRAMDPNWKDIGLEVAREAVRQLPTAPKRYDYEGAIFVGIQVLLNRPKIERLKNPIPYCFEGISDLYLYKGYDVVPQVENGAVLGDHFDQSDRLFRL